MVIVVDDNEVAESWSNYDIQKMFLGTSFKNDIFRVIEKTVILVHYKD